jgi:hypothetical protein
VQNPQGVGFWDKIWTPFAEQLRQDLAQERELARESDSVATFREDEDSLALA